eukprot:1939843-Rhodomonas_salina.2
MYARDGAGYGCGAVVHGDNADVILFSSFFLRSCNAAAVEDLGGGPAERRPAGRRRRRQCGVVIYARRDSVGDERGQTVYPPRQTPGKSPNPIENLDPGTNRELKDPNERSHLFKSKCNLELGSDRGYWSE